MKAFGRGRRVTLVILLLSVFVAGCFFEDEEVEPPEADTPTPEPTSTPAPTDTPEGPKQVGEGSVTVDGYFHQNTGAGDDTQIEDGTVAFFVMRDANGDYSLTPKGVGQFKFSEELIAPVCGFQAHADGFYHVSGSLDTREACTLRVSIAATYNAMQIDDVFNCPGELGNVVPTPRQYGPVNFPLEKNHTVVQGAQPDVVMRFTLTDLSLDASVPCPAVEGN
jgi:hypothetical protein